MAGPAWQVALSTHIEHRGARKSTSHHTVPLLYSSPPFCFPAFHFANTLALTLTALVWAYFGAKETYPCRPITHRTFLYCLCVVVD